MNGMEEYRDGSLTFQSGIPVPRPRTVSTEKLRARMKREGPYAVMNIDGDKNRVGFWRGSEYMDGPGRRIAFGSATEPRRPTPATIYGIAMYPAMFSTCRNSAGVQIFANALL